MIPPLLVSQILTLEMGTFQGGRSLTELQSVYEYCLGKQLDKRNFRKKMLSLDILEPTELRRTGERARPAMLYRAREREMRIIPLFK